MSKVKVTVISLEPNIQIAKFGGGGTYGGTRMTYRTTFQGAQQVKEKGFANVFLDDPRQATLKMQLEGLAKATFPVDVVLESSSTTGKDGKSYNNITQILPGSTEITASDQPQRQVFVPQDNGGRASDRGTFFPQSPNKDAQIARAVALKAAVELAGVIPGSASVSGVIANAKLLEAYLMETESETVTSTTTEVTSEPTEATTFKF